MDYLIVVFVALICIIISCGRRKHTTTQSSEDNMETPPAVITPNNKTGRKYGLLVGINKYAMEGADLRGCVNDIDRMWHLATTKYGFEKDDIRLLADERATQQGILERLEWLVTVPTEGDHLFFHYSGHGSQIRDRNGDELDDQMDEILCPHDLSWEDPLTDDILATFFRRIPKGVVLTFVCDSCHSGSMNRGELMPGGNPHPMKARFLPPPFDVAARGAGRALPIDHIGVKGIGDRGVGDVHVVDQNHVLLSGCRDNQTSADAFLEGKYQGALTANLAGILEQFPEYDWKHIHEDVLKGLSKKKFTQVPQLTGSELLLENVPLGGAV